MAVFRVAVIGAGFGQQVHIPVFRSFPDCKVVTICASDKIKAQSVAEKISIPESFGDWSTENTSNPAGIPVYIPQGSKPLEPIIADSKPRPDGSPMNMLLRGHT